MSFFFGKSPKIIKPRLQEEGVLTAADLSLIVAEDELPDGLPVFVQRKLLHHAALLRQGAGVTMLYGWDLV